MISYFFQHDHWLKITEKVYQQYYRKKRYLASKHYNVVVELMGK